MAYRRLHGLQTIYAWNPFISSDLGIYVVPDYDGSGKDRGLLVQGIELGGRIDMDGRLTIYDKIVEINGQNLIDNPF